MYISSYRERIHAVKQDDPKHVTAARVLRNNSITGHNQYIVMGYLVQNNAVSINRFLKQDRFTRLPSVFIKNYRIIMHTLPQN